MLMIFDANVHVGRATILGCNEDQDWGGKEIMQLIKDENLILVNSSERCTGIITRIDPRTGKGSTIDLAICNQFMEENILEMKIDEDENYKPTNFGKSIKKTVHNTIVMKVKLERGGSVVRKPYLNTRNLEGRELLKEYFVNAKINGYLKCPLKEVNIEFEVLNELWTDALKSSFKKVKPKKMIVSGVTKTVRDLMKEEEWIRENILNNPERGRKIAEIRKCIKQEIDKNRTNEILQSIHKIRVAKNPQGEVFKIRREKNRVEKVGFPLKDSNGNIQVSKDGIDRVVLAHFDKVFKQNPIPNGEIWDEYWKKVDEVFDILNEQKDNVHFVNPTYEEIKAIVMSTNDNKSVLGTMTTELIKVIGDDMIKLIHRLILSCCKYENIADGMRNEKLIILYKNKGPLTEMDNYRGIFIRLIVLSILQKWLYMKCSPIVDMNGSELAFGGRKGRSVNEVLLIVRLMQDYCHWNKQPLIFKFLDITNRGGC